MYTALFQIEDHTDRRISQRFPMAEEVNYKVFVNRNSFETGVGTTLNMSSNGVLFTTQKPLLAGQRLELSVNWPAQLNDKCLLKLVARGRVVRVEGEQAAIAIDNYEFRTRRTGGEIRPLYR